MLSNDPNTTEVARNSNRNSNTHLTFSEDNRMATGSMDHAVASLSNLTIDPTANNSNTDHDNEMMSVTMNTSAARPMVATLSSPWQFDDLCTTCAVCKAEFNPINRRHHCRLCGNIFCGPCTAQRALIPPSSIVLTPVGGIKAKSTDAPHAAAAASGNSAPEEDPDRMLTYLSEHNKELLYGKGLEERFKLAREPLRVCKACYQQLLPLQPDLRNCNSNAMRFNPIDPTDPRRLFNSPVAFTLGHEIRKAAYTLNNLLPLPKRMGAFTTMASASSNYASSSGAAGGGGLRDDLYDITSPSTATAQCRDTCATVSPNLGNVDGIRIPARLLEQAKGIAVMTVLKTGFGLAGFEFGTGLVVARLDGGRWSAPSAIGTAGLSWGALVGAQVSDHVFVLMNDAAVELLFHPTGSVQLGADIGVAVGPVGRSLEADLGAAVGTNVAPIYTYSLSKGFYAGISLDGKVITTRDLVNEKFYGCAVTAREILQGAVPTPPAAQPLYEALQRCHVYATTMQSQNKHQSSYGRPRPDGQVLPTASFGSGRNSTAVEEQARLLQQVDNYMSEYGELPPGIPLPPSPSLQQQQQEELLRLQHEQHLMYQKQQEQLLLLQQQQQHDLHRRRMFGGGGGGESYISDITLDRELLEKDK